MPNVKAMDETLVEAMRNGDQGALGRIIEKYTAYVGTNLSGTLCATNWVRPMRKKS